MLSPHKLPRDYLHLLVKYGLEPPSQLGDEPLDATARLDLRPGVERADDAAESA